MDHLNNKVAVIGAGPMGLMTAYELLKKGHKVTIFEADDRIGGMSASFDFDGTMIERFYHFVCKPDQPLFDLLSEFNILERLKWKNTKMGFYYEGKLYPWGDPLSLLIFPKLNFITKIRYGLMISKIMKITNWSKLDKINATAWLKKQLGEHGYNTLWKNLFYYKFYRYKDDLSAAWLGTRIKRVGLSRKNIFQESLGYLDGGSDTLLNLMQKKIEALGGVIKLRSPVSEITTNDDQIQGVKVSEQFFKFDQVISTIPLPILKKMAICLSEVEIAKISSIIHVGVICVLFKLKCQLTENFWLNINDKKMEIPGVIEHTNLNTKDEKIIYIPYYMPQNHPKYDWDDTKFILEVKGYLKRINTNFCDDWILATHVARYPFAQAVCPPEFYDQLPPMQSSLKGFFMADTSYCYPEDRSISESVRIGKTLARLADENTRRTIF